jgi:hypothetical protein
MKQKRLIVIIVLVLLGALFFVTTFYTGGKKESKLPPGTHGVVIKEVIQTSNYTYFNVEESDSTFWIAVTSRDAKPNDSLYYTKSAEMKNFTSRELNRNFPSIFFVDDPSSTLTTAAAAPNAMTAQKPVLKRWTEVSVDPPAGGVSISALYENPGKYSGKSVIVRGVVVKYNSAIMNKNWVHLQDGSEFEGKFDLTVTTTDSITVGKTATFKGTISVNKDFGSGYFYGLIMEDAKASDINN